MIVLANVLTYQVQGWADSRYRLVAHFSHDDSLKAWFFYNHVTNVGKTLRSFRIVLIDREYLTQETHWRLSSLAFCWWGDRKENSGMSYVIDSANYDLLDPKVHLPPVHEVTHYTMYGDRK